MLTFEEWLKEVGKKTTRPGVYAEYIAYERAQEPIEPPRVPYTPKPPAVPYIPLPPTPPKVTVVNRSQQVYTSGLHPISAYSRVESINLMLEKDGTFAWNYTRPVGNKVWLTHVKVQVMAKPENLSQGTAIILYAGQGVPNSFADLDSWARILPLFNQIKQRAPWMFIDGVNVLEWDLSILYKGENRRFAVGGYRVGGFRADSIWVSFTIAEG